ncbi:MAG TPA: DUF2934 domain-containing protein [Verrucomicrobiae bacterium]
MRNRTKKAPAAQQSEISPIGNAQKIQQRAYELFLQRGQQPGNELEDWLQAEREVCAPEHHHETA